MSELLAKALSALGKDPTARELELVADALRQSQDAVALAILDAAGDGDDAAFGALVEIASSAGSSGLVALDLITTYRGRARSSSGARLNG